MTMLSSNHCNLWLGIQNHPSRGRFNQIICPGSGPYIPSRGSFFFHGQCLAGSSHQSARRCRPIFSSTVDDGMDPDDSKDGIDKKQPSNGELGGVNSEMIRENLERIVGSDDSAFSGLDLATLIRNKYGRSYDVLLIKKEFMGRNLLALNVMWKYMEQTVSWFSVAACKDLVITHSGFKFWMVSCGMPHDITCPDIGLVQSRLVCRLLTCRHEIFPDSLMKLTHMCYSDSIRSFPLTEEEYLLRLDDVANTLKCWGAVSHIRNSLEKLKERPRIGKAVSIFIDMDESGGRSNEWIYK